MYMPLMVQLHRVLLLTASEAPAATQELQPIVRQRLRALRPFLDETAGEKLEIVRQSELCPSKTQSDGASLDKTPPDWSAWLLAQNGRESDLNGTAVRQSRQRADLVVSCLLNEDWNASLLDFCAKHGILCNVVDQKEFCNTWFMGIAQTDSLLLAVSSKGKCPYYVAQLRRELQQQLSQRESEAALLSECRNQLQQGRSEAPEVLGTFEALSGRELQRALGALHRSTAFAKATMQLQSCDRSKQGQTEYIAQLAEGLLHELSYAAALASEPNESSVQAL